MEPSVIKRAKEPFVSGPNEQMPSLLFIDKQVDRSPYGQTLVLALSHVENGPQDMNCQIDEDQQRVDSIDGKFDSKELEKHLSICAFGVITSAFRTIDQDFEYFNYGKNIADTDHQARKLDIENFAGVWERWTNRLPLKVFPIAGVDEMSFYQRQGEKVNDTNNHIKFFYFEGQDHKNFYTAGSLDIVAHESGHAILDLIKPSLSGSKRFETLALHESFGDLMAMFTTVEHPVLRADLLTLLGKSLKDKSFLPVIARSFAIASGKAYDRTAINNLTMQTAGGLTYPLSQVFTGAIFDLMDVEFQRAVEKYTREVSHDQILFEIVRKIRRHLVLTYINLKSDEPNFAEFGRVFESLALTAPFNLLSADQIYNVFFNRGINIDAKNPMNVAPENAQLHCRRPDTKKISE